MYGELVRGRDLAALVLVVGGLTMGIHAIGKAVHVHLGGEELREVDGKVARCPVVHGGYIPDVALATGDGNVFAHLAGQRDGFVEGGGDGCYEGGALLVLHPTALMSSRAKYAFSPNHAWGLFMPRMMNS